MSIKKIIIPETWLIQPVLINDSWIDGRSKYVNIFNHKILCIPYFNLQFEQEGYLMHLNSDCSQDDSFKFGDFILKSEDQITLDEFDFYKKNKLREDKKMFNLIRKMPEFDGKKFECKFCFKETILENKNAGYIKYLIVNFLKK